MLLLPATLHAEKTVSLIPVPAQCNENGGTFILTDKTTIISTGKSDSASKYFIDKAEKSTGYSFSVKRKGGQQNAKNNAVIFRESNVGLPAEGYTLDITPEHAVISAKDSAGYFYGVQTLLQLLPPEIFTPHEAKDIVWEIPCVHIEDAPRFAWRGMHLDPSRHFIPFKTLITMVDVMAMHKLNLLHLHLTDSEGWRIQIDAYPLLTEIGSRGDYSSPGKGEAKFYTKEQIKTLISYAAERHITVMPEIDVPGHCGAVSRSYPELCLDHKTLNIAKPETIDFIKTVFHETAELFPGPYLHFGGDEVNTRSWKKNNLLREAMKDINSADSKELLRSFYRHVAEIIVKEGKIPVGWDEIADAGVNKKSVVMWWRSTSADSLRTALSKGYHAVLAPNNPLYFNFSEVDFERGAPWRSGTNSKKEIYDLNPIPSNLTEHKERILGVQCCLWGEFIENTRTLQYMLLPRLAVLAEIAWSAKNLRNFNGMLTRLEKEKERYSAYGLYFRKGYKFAKLAEITAENGKLPGETFDITKFISGSGTYLLRISQENRNPAAEPAEVKVTADGETIVSVKKPTINGFRRKWPRWLSDYIIRIDSYNPKTEYRLEILPGTGTGTYLLKFAKVQPEGFGEITR